MACTKMTGTGWRQTNRGLGHKVQIVGDDLFVTNVDRLSLGIERQSANSILIKLNQIGTLSETIDAVQLATRNGFTCIISHRSGGNRRCHYCGFGGCFKYRTDQNRVFLQADRVAKYNQLLRICDILGDSAFYPGKSLLGK